MKVKWSYVASVAVILLLILLEISRIYYIMPFPGSDPREFWQRAEERTQNTAKLYDKLGMAEYQAIEVFVKMF